MRSRWTVLVFLLSWAGAREARALNPTRDVTQYLVDFWQDGSGLPHNHVYTVLQTHDGYVWVGTRGGLGRFDGVRFTLFSDQRPDELRESEVWALTEGQDGSLWIGTYGGGLARMSNGTFKTYTQKEGLPSDFVLALATAPDGAVWVGLSKGLVRIQKDGRIEAFDVQAGAPAAPIHSLHFDPSGVLWIGGEKSLGSFTGGRFVEHPEIGTDARIETLSGDPRQGLWIGTWGHGLARLKDGVLTRFADTDGMPAEKITVVHVDPQGVPWIGSQEGLWRYRDGKFERFFSDIVNPGRTRTLRTVSLRAVRALYSDREGNVWLGTQEDGLARFRDSLFTTVSVGQSDGVDGKVTSVFEDSRGRVWLGAPDGARCLENGVLTPYEVGGTPANTFAEDAAGTIWVGSSRGLFRWKSKGFEMVELPGLLAHKDTAIATMLGDKQGRVWIGARGAGLFLYAEGRIHSFARGTPDGLPGDQIRALSEDREGAVWIGTKDAGLIRWKGGDRQVYTLKDGLPSDAVSAVYADAEGVVWVATRQGLMRIENGRLVKLVVQDGLPANYFYQIVEDDRGFLWFTCARGVARVSKKELNARAKGGRDLVTSEVFGGESGIRSTAMVVPNQPVAWKGRDGRLWFASAHGTAVVDPASMVQNTLPPSVWIEDVVVDGQSRMTGAAATYPAGRGDFEFHYVGLSFVAPERVRFQYRLDGIDNDWIQAGTRRTAYYTKLTPGEYVFRVKACNNDGVWNESPATFQFELQPHWYQRRTFHVMVVVLVGLGLFGVHRQRLAAHKRREAELAQAVDAALAQVKTLSGMLPICAGCKKIRDDTGYWNQMETYIHEHSGADFSHGMCPECLQKLYPEFAASQSSKLAG